MAVYRFLCSLKLAVTTILLLAAALAVGTFVESLYDIQTGRFWVYRSFWFNGLLVLLGLNIFCVALSRYPWKKKHIPFLVAHIGILTLLVGSFITQKFGIDATMVVSEGQTTSTIELEESLLTVSTMEGQSQTIEIPWRPHNVSFSPIELSKFGVRVEKYLSHAEPVYEFTSAKTPDAASKSAIQLHFSIRAMGVSQTFWLWGGDPSWSRIQLGPAQFILLPESYPISKKAEAQKNTLIQFRKRKDGSLEYKAFSKKGGEKTGIVRVSGKQDVELNTGWGGPMGPVQLVVKAWFPQAENSSYFKKSRTQFGQNAPPPAIWIRALDGGSGVWLGRDQEVEFFSQGQRLRIFYTARRLALPFSLFLDQFSIQTYPGTSNPASYSSQVKVVGAKGLDPNQKITISMNEPLEWGGYTFYQSSYIPGVPRPITSVFSVNRDPGRFLKYLGSIFIVLGSTMLFAVKVLKKRKRSKSSV